MKAYFFVFLSFLALQPFAQSQIPLEKIREFDQYVERVRQEWEVPGMAITVVKDGKVLLKKGYGVRELGQPDRVDTQTLFSCASTTKAMTAAVLGILVDEGKIAWDDPVREYIPELTLYDPYVTRELRIRDLLLHNTGLPGTDFLSGAMAISAEETFRKLALVKPAYSFRSSYEYQNTMYAVAGHLIERVEGKQWTEVMIEKMFKPLGMIHTVPRRALANTANMTKPHFPVNGKIQVLNYGRESPIGSAGAVWSCADDMTLWVKCMLDSSKYEGGRLLKPETWKEILRPQTMFPESEYPTLSILKPHWQTYSLGWYQHDYKGKIVYFHTGSIAGLTAIIGLLPEENLGVFVFGNYDHAEVRHAIMYHTFDWFALGLTRDWNQEFKILYTRLREEEAQRQLNFENQRVLNTKSSLPLSSYEGVYSSLLYGKAEVAVEGDRLKFNVNNVILATLPHWHFDTFFGTYGQWHQYKALTIFTLGVSGKPDVLLFNGLEFRK